MVTPEQHEMLQRYLDGDLSEAEQSALEGQLAQDQSLSGELAALRRLHAMIVESGEFQAAQLDSEAMFARISAAVAPVETEQAASAEKPAPSFWERLMHGGLWAPAGGALAVAAALLLTIYLPMDNTKLDNERPKTELDTPAPSTPAAPQVEAPAAPAARPPVNSEVVQVDFGNNAGTVFEIALADGAVAPVVWINDEEE